MTADLSFFNIEFSFDIEFNNECDIEFDIEFFCYIEKRQICRHTIGKDDFLIFIALFSCLKISCINIGVCLFLV